MQHRNFPRLSITLPAELLEELDHSQQRQLGWSRSAVIQQALYDWLRPITSTLPRRDAPPEPSAPRQAYLAFMKAIKDKESQEVIAYLASRFEAACQQHYNRR